MEIIYLIIGLLIGAVAAYFVSRSKGAASAALLEAERKARSEEREQSVAQVDALKQDHADALAGLKTECEERINTAKAECEERINRGKAESEKRIEAIKTESERRLEAAKREAEAQIANIKEEAKNTLQQAKQDADEQRAKELGELQKRYDVLLQQFKAEVTTATEKLLKERSGELQQANTQRMEEVFKPIRENIDRMERSINENREAAARNSASFEKSMQQMMETNLRLGSQAERLSTALQRKNKTSGNWGELILSELLESQGLKPGIHFDVQQTMKDGDGHSILNEDTGSRMIPDVILHLADERDVIVDSKMSLTAFIDYQNAEDEAERQDALARHIESVRSHIKELSAKNYSDYIVKPKKSIDFVIMFVPIEGALQLALSTAPSLWREAFDKKVFIAGGQTLMAALRIIDMTWVNVLQERNTQNVMDEARKLLNRVYSFYEKFEDLGKKIGDVSKAYEVADQRVKSGPQSILAMGNRLEELGARGRKSLPQPDRD